MQTFHIAKIREGYDLRNLENYGFRKTEPVKTNPWWQKTIEVRPYQGILLIECQLCVSNENRNLLLKYENYKYPDKVNSIVEKMKQDGVFEDYGYLRCKDKICYCRKRIGGNDIGDYYVCKCTGIGIDYGDDECLLDQWEREEEESEEGKYDNVR